MKTWIIFILCSALAGMGVNFVLNKQAQIDVLKQSESMQQQVELLKKEILFLKLHIVSIAEPESHEHPHPHPHENVPEELVAEGDDEFSEPDYSPMPYLDEDGVLTFPFPDSHLQEEVCVDWVEGSDCYLGMDSHIADLVFDPNNGRVRSNRMEIVAQSKDFWPAMERAALQKSKQESWTREGEINTAMYEAVTNEPGIEGGEFLCSDDLCGAVFHYDNWDHFMAFAESSPMWGNELLGNMWLLPAELGIANTEIRVLTTPLAGNTIWLTDNTTSGN